MSNICSKPEVWSTGEGEILYFVNIYEEDWELKVELDSEWNIKTNINRLINKIVDYEKKWKIISVDHDLYSRLNSWINIVTLEIREEVQERLENLYINSEKNKINA